MAQTTILASGTTAAASTDIVVSAGSVVKVAIFSTNPGASLAGRGFEIFDVTPAAENLIGYLDEANRSTLLAGPGTYRVRRPVLATAFGVSLDA
jgi:hypothetical protein